MFYFHRKIKRILAFYKTDYEAIQKAESEKRRTPDILKTIKETAITNQREDIVEDTPKNLEYRCYQLQNPNPKVALSYSILTNGNYQFLPNIINNSTTQVAMYEKAKEMAKNQLSDLFTLLYKRDFAFEFKEFENKLIASKDGNIYTLTVNFYALEKEEFYWMLCEVETDKIKVSNDVIIKFNNFIGNFLYSNKDKDSLSYFYLYLLELFIYNEQITKLIHNIDIDQNTVFRLFKKKITNSFDIGKKFTNNLFKLFIKLFPEFTGKEISNMNLEEFYLKNSIDTNYFYFKCSFNNFLIRDTIGALSETICIRDIAEMDYYFEESKMFKITKTFNIEELEVKIFNQLYYTIFFVLFSILKGSEFIESKKLSLVLSTKESVSGLDSSFLHYFEEIKHDSIAYIKIQEEIDMFVFLDLKKIQKDLFKLIKVVYRSEDIESSNEDRIKEKKKEIQNYLYKYI